MKVTDPVCGMSVESGKAAATETHQGHTYYFCSARCRDTFKADPTRYAGKAASAAGQRHGIGHLH